MVVAAVVQRRVCTHEGTREIAYGPMDAEHAPMSNRAVTRIVDELDVLSVDEQPTRRETLQRIALIRAANLEFEVLVLLDRRLSRLTLVGAVVVEFQGEAGELQGQWLDGKINGVSIDLQDRVPAADLIHGVFVIGRVRLTSSPAGMFVVRLVYRFGWRMCVRGRRRR